MPAPNTPFTAIESSTEVRQAVHIADSAHRPSPLRAAALLLTAAITAAGPTVVVAADLRDVLGGYTIASWTRKDGLPTTHVRALAQDHEGYLWIGTDAGLLRFDGVQFVPWEVVHGVPLPNRPVRALFTSRDRSIWIGFAEDGGIARLQSNGRVQIFGEADGLGVGREFLASFAEDLRGQIWVGRSDGLYRFADDAWQRWTPGHGIGVGAVRSTYVDARGALVIGTDDGVFRGANDGEIFERIDDSSNPVRSIAADRLNRIWATDARTGVKLVGDHHRAGEHPERGVGGHIIADRDGLLWVATIQGLWRLRPPLEFGTPPLIEKATASTGLLADGLTCLLTDRDGNIWVGTSDGLNRLTPYKVRSRTDLGFASAVEATATGIWIGSPDELIQFPSSQSDGPALRHRIAGTIVTIHADARGAIWIATTRGVDRVTTSGSKVDVSHVLPLSRVTAITSDSDGGIWLNDQEDGLVRWDGHRVVAVEKVPRPIYAMHASRGGRLWMVAGDGKVAVVEADRQVRIYGTPDGLLGTGYNTIYEGHDGAIWFGGTEGLSRFADDRFVTLKRSDSFPLQSFRAILEDEEGQLWLGTEAGIARVDRVAINQAFQEPGRPLKYSLYDLSDGLAGFPLFAPGNRRALRAATGQLWFVTHRGVTIIDPKALEITVDQPPVRIERIVVGDTQFQASPKLVLPPRSSRLQIEYVLLNLTSPLKTRFRYQLEGLDSDWIDAGSRRQALYTNLPPRSYRFLVQADNNQGTWGMAAVQEFSITPVFYQTRWFSSVVAAGIIVLTWSAWRLRLRRIHERFELVLGERTRLSREIHDTLLQSLVGVALQLDAVAEEAGSSPQTIKDRLVRMRRHVEDYVREARESIGTLRSRELMPRDFATALKRVGERATVDTGIEFGFTLDGPPIRCPLDVEMQLIRIVHEAVHNAVHHARPRRVWIDLRYQERTVRLQVVDDGCGFDVPEVSAGTNGHYGLLTMRERADSIDANLQIRSHAGGGTEVEAVVIIPPPEDESELDDEA